MPFNFRTALQCCLPLTLLACQESNEASKAAAPDNTEAVQQEVTLLQVSTPREITFNQHVQPILSEYCYHCHGPDSGTRKPEDDPLRLDRAEYAFAKRDGAKPLIVKGKPEESELIRLIKSQDPDEIMPPEESHKTMNGEEIAIIEEWIRQGAEYQEHWAYIPIEKPAVPKSAHPNAKNPVDHFIANELAKNGLKPNKEENRSRLLRRLNFDLTGLPPTPEELTQFVTDKRDTDTVLREKVDQLLASVAYAENFTRHWLDAARYADTHGIHIDNYRAIWPYRDWVINAYKQNMPYDQFTIEQLAGDILEKPTLDQIIATGFNRCLPTTGEGGAIPEEYDAVYAQDRTDTTAAVWLGMTTTCASCHDHKFDPLATKEVYQFNAFFRNTTMHAMDRNNGEHPPNTFVPSSTDRKRWRQVHQLVTASNLKKESIKQSQQAQFKTWVELTKNQNAGLKQPTGAVIDLPLSSKKDGAKDSTGKTYKIHGKATWIDGITEQALQFTRKSYVELGNIGDFERDQPFSYSIWIKSNHGFSGAVVARIDKANGHRGWDLWMQDGYACFDLINTHPKNLLKVRTTERIPKDTWTQITMTYDGSSKAEGVRIYVNGVSQKLHIESNQLTKTTKTKTSLKLGKRSTDQYFSNGAVQNFKLFNRTLTAQEATSLAKVGTIQRLVQIPFEKLNKQQRDILKKFYFDSANAPYKAHLVSHQVLAKELSDIEKRGSKTLIMEEKKDQLPFAHILIRGDYSNKGEKVTPGTPAILPPMLESQPKNRLGLAQWLVDKRNPLTPRVTVNRYWYYFFGTGIVESTEDFGIMGARPSHAELLDWLAADFTENDWDVHHLIRQIVTSATYRQSALVTTEVRQKDLDNRLLSRGPRFRLDAEQIRDLALASSSLLSTKVGGKSVKPYQPKNVWESVAMKSSNTRIYKQDTGESLYRRSIYTFWKRTAPHPSMEILNAPVRETFCVRRDLTNTPLQAFVVMNDPQFVEATRMVAQKVIKQEASFEDRANLVGRLMLARNFETRELKILKQTLDTNQKHYKANPEEAKKLIAVGQSIADPALDPAELAAWSIIASQVLNLDETLCK